MIDSQQFSRDLDKKLWSAAEFCSFDLLARSDALRAHAIQNMIGTSGRQRVPSECFEKFLIAMPPCNIAERFDELTEALMAKIKENSDQSRTLATLRDSLLPKLLSGDLPVNTQPIN